MNRQLRFKFLELMLAVYGRLNRSTIESMFDLSTVQVSHDLKAYMEQHPGNIVYDKAARCYIPSPEFKSHYQ